MLKYCGRYIQIETQLQNEKRQSMHPTKNIRAACRFIQRAKERHAASSNAQKSGMPLQSKVTKHVSQSLTEQPARLSQTERQAASTKKVRKTQKHNLYVTYM